MKKFLGLGVFFFMALYQVVFSQEDIRNSFLESKGRDAGYMFAFTEATKMFLFGDYSGAANLYQECLKYNPESAAANYQLAEIYLKAGDIRKAKQYSLKAHFLDPVNKWYILQSGNIFQSMQVLDSAIIMYKKLLNGSLQDISVYYQIAALMEKGKDYRQSLFYLEKIENEVGQTRETLLGKSRIYENLGMKKEALGQLRLAIVGHEEDYVVYGMMAEHFRMMSKNDSAEYYYEKIYYNHQDDANVVLSYGEFLLATEQNEKAVKMYASLFGNSRVDDGIKVRYLYSALQDQNFFNKIRPIIDTAVNILLKNSPGKLNIMSLYCDVNYRLGNYDASSNVLREIIAMDETNYRAWEQLMFCESARENNDTVIYYGKKAISKFSDRPLPYLIMASVYYAEERYSESVDLLKAGEAYADTDDLKIEFYSLLAECYGKAEDYLSSDKYYNAAMELDSANLGVMNNYAYSLAMRGEKLDTAKRLSGYTILIEPNSATFLDTYAWVLYKRREIKEAQRYIKKAIKLGGNKNAEIWEHYGDIMLERGKKRDAIEAWNEARALSSEQEKVRINEKITNLD